MHIYGEKKLPLERLVSSDMVRVVSSLTDESGLSFKEDCRIEIN